MNRSDPEQFREGTRLRYPIYDGRGVLLLGAGAILTPHLVSILDRRGIRLKLTAILKVVAGGEIGLEIPIQDSCVLTIGRNENCALRPVSKLVSGYHCVVIQLPMWLFVEDMKSTNGTFVNGMKIDKPNRLNDGDIIQFGGMTLEVQLIASLEGSAQEVEEIAGLILQSEDGVDREPEAGKTMLADTGVQKHIAEALQEAWRRKQGLLE